MIMHVGGKQNCNVPCCIFLYVIGVIFCKSQSHMVLINNGPLLNVYLINQKDEIGSR